MTAPLDHITDEIVESARGGYRLLRDGDPALLELLDPDVEWHVPESLPGGGTLHGQWELLEFLGRIAETWDAHPEPEEFLPAGDALIVLGTWRGRVRATGVTVAVPFVHVQRFRGGLLVECRFLADTATVLQSLDAGPPA